jgi:hypothetical protein
LGKYVPQVPNDFEQISHLLKKAHDIGAYQIKRRDDPQLKNNPPKVNAGEDSFVIFSGSIASWNLDGTILDDGLPYNSLTATWELVKGPAEPVFNDDDNENTAVQFTTEGAYMLRLIADDGELSASDFVVVFVYPEFAAGGEVKIEAENMLLHWCTIIDQDAASGGKYISLEKSHPYGERAVALFPGPAGQYDISVAYFVEYDGIATQKLMIYRNGDTVYWGPSTTDVFFEKSWRYDAQLTGNEPSSDKHNERTIQTGIYLKPGDVLYFDGRDQAEGSASDTCECEMCFNINLEKKCVKLTGTEWVTIDYIKFVPTTGT